MLSNLYIWLWWHVRVDPTGRVKSLGLLTFAVTTLVVAMVLITSAMSNSLMPKPLLAVASASESKEVAAPKAEKKDKSKPKRQQRIVVKGNAVSAGAVPDSLFSVYREAAQECNMQWEVLAAVGWVESHHGSLAAPGVKSGANFAGAKGPMQFLSSTWSTYGVDANNDGKADIYNSKDAIHGAAKYLCANGAGDPARLRNALWNYNHSQAYINEVLSVAKGYSQDTYVFPLPSTMSRTLDLGRPHHDYPAIDVSVPTGTPITAAHGGTVTRLNDGACGDGVVIKGFDDATYTYCHLSKVNVENRAVISAGESIGLSGGVAGSEGAGSSTGPHFHLSIDVGSSRVCPQSLMQSWSEGKAASPQSAARSGCIS